MRKIHTIIYHHSASDDPSHDNIATIREWHLMRGWKGEGYHYYIRKDGSVELGRPLDMDGAHCKENNDGTVGICLGGSYVFTDIQFHIAARLAYDIRKIYPRCTIKAHKNYRATDCPRYSIKIIKERLYVLETASATSVGWWYKGCS